MPLSNQTALITGASRGIGQSIALHLGKLGAKIIGTATTEDGASLITEYLKLSGINGIGVKMNVTDQGSIDQAFSWMADAVGMPSLLVNNAGMTSDNLFLRMKWDEWDRIINTNLSGVYRLIRASLPSMIKARFGRIVNISSVVAFTGNPGQANYAAAKAGMIGLTKSLAREVASRGITVNAVAPGYIDTDMTRDLTEEQQDKLSVQIPIGRVGKPTDISNAVGFLVLPESGYITGETLHVNGGLYMS